LKKGMGSTEKAFPPVKALPTAVGRKEDAQEWEKERAESSFRVVHASSLLNAGTWANICQMWSLIHYVYLYP